MSGAPTKACSRCKQVKALGMFRPRKRKSGVITPSSSCKQCLSAAQKEWHKKTWQTIRRGNLAYARTKNVESFIRYLQYKTKNRIKQTGWFGEGWEKSFVTAEFLLALWHKQGGKCALTGWPMTMVHGKGNILTNCSIDRIDSNLGYTEDNVQLLCKVANIAKQTLSMADFIELCSSVARVQNAQNTSLE